MPPKGPSGKDISDQIDGLPEGWQCLEKMYLSGKSQGQTYIRFQNKKHKNVLSLKACMERHCEDNNLDFATEWENIEKMREAKREERAAQSAAEREKRGIIQGQKREEAIAVFRAKFGKLDGATITALPGWRGDSKVLENCGQVVATYYDPDGNEFKLLKDIEAHFGMKMMNGQEIPDIEKARASVTYDEKGRPVNVARRENCEDLETQNKKRRLAQLEVCKDLYQEAPGFAVVPLLGEAGAAKAATGSDDAGLRKSAAEIHELLLGRGFSKETGLLAVVGKEADSKVLAALRGIYYKLSDGYNSRPCYQRVLQCPGSAGAALACTGQYIFWSERRGSWKIGALDDAKIGFAFCPEDQPLPTALGTPWQILKPSAVAAS